MLLLKNGVKSQGACLRFRLLQRAGCIPAIPAKQSALHHCGQSGYASHRKIARPRLSNPYELVPRGDMIMDGV